MFWKEERKFTVNTIFTALAIAMVENIFFKKPRFFEGI